MTISDAIRTAPLEVATSIVRSKLTTDDDWLRRALTALHNKQTPQEQSAQSTVLKNDVGFNGADAPLLSSFAEQVKRGSLLSERQLAIARRKLPKYARQLVNIARAKAPQA